MTYLIICLFIYFCSSLIGFLFRLRQSSVPPVWGSSERYFNLPGKMRFVSPCNDHQSVLKWNWREYLFYLSLWLPQSSFWEVSKNLIRAWRKAPCISVSCLCHPQGPCGVIRGPVGMVTAVLWGWLEACASKDRSAADSGTFLQPQRAGRPSTGAVQEPGSSQSLLA